MTNPPDFNRAFVPHYGTAVAVDKGIMRLTCHNPSPFTYTGTNSYIVGAETLAVVDPGPADQAHLDLLLKTIDNRPVSHIFITHTHMDHSPLAAPLQELTGAKLVGAAPHFSARELHIGETNALDASADRDYSPDAFLDDGDAIDGDGWTLEAIHTPGHTANHLAFALKDTGTVFTGDHVMGWATSIVAPPDGSMSDYMHSLEKLLERDDSRYLPGHGGQIKNPHAFVRALRLHRKMRERAIVERLERGDETIAQIVSEIYRDTDPRLHGAAGLSVYAHMEDLMHKGRVVTDSPPSVQGRYRLV